MEPRRCGYVSVRGRGIRVKGQVKGEEQLKWREVAYTFNKRED